MTTQLKSSSALAVDSNIFDAPSSSSVQPINSDKTNKSPPKQPSWMIDQPTITPTMAVPVDTVPLGSESQEKHCPKCRKSVRTKINPIPGVLTWLSCFLICWCGLICGCCLLPFGIVSCLDIEHSCPNCDHKFGKYRRL